MGWPIIAALLGLDKPDSCYSDRSIVNRAPISDTAQIELCDRRIAEFVAQHWQLYALIAALRAVDRKCENERVGAKPLTLRERRVEPICQTAGHKKR